MRILVLIVSYVVIYLPIIEPKYKSESVYATRSINSEEKYSRDDIEPHTGGQPGKYICEKRTTGRGLYGML